MVKAGAQWWSGLYDSYIEGTHALDINCEQWPPKNSQVATRYEPTDVIAFSLRVRLSS